MKRILFGILGLTVLGAVVAKYVPINGAKPEGAAAPAQTLSVPSASPEKTVPQVPASPPAVPLAPAASPLAKSQDSGSQLQVRSLEEIPSRCSHGKERCEIVGDLWELYQAERSAIKADPQRLRQTLGYLSRRYLEAHPEALPVVERMIQDAYPESETARYQFSAYAYWAVHDFPRASDQYDHLVKHFPEGRLPIADMAVFYYEAGNYAAALAWEEKIVKGGMGGDPDFLMFHQKRIQELQEKLGK